MHAANYLQKPVESLLDVGCNVGAWLADCAQAHPEARLAGVEINAAALDVARHNVPHVDLRHCGAEDLPFPDASFQYVTCLEVLEHLPADLRAEALREFRRILRPGGRLILTVPHAGWFAWCDSNNMRFRLPGLFRLIVGSGRRDANYATMGRMVEWHHHFTDAELLRLAGDGWRIVATRHGGSIIYPLMDWLSWPFYRCGRHQHFLRRSFERIAGWDYAVDFGRASYGVLMVLERLDCHA
jgi:SAM-dependent methyltransferase